jgi:hypothetical protein
MNLPITTQPIPIIANLIANSSMLNLTAQMAELAKQVVVSEPNTTFNHYNRTRLACELAVKMQEAQSLFRQLAGEYGLLP